MNYQNTAEPLPEPTPQKKPKNGSLSTRKAMSHGRLKRLQKIAHSFKSLIVIKIPNASCCAATPTEWRGSGVVVKYAKARALSGFLMDSVRRSLRACEEIINAAVHLRTFKGSAKECFEHTRRILIGQDEHAYIRVPAFPFSCFGRDGQIHILYIVIDIYY